MTLFDDGANPIMVCKGSSGASGSGPGDQYKRYFGPIPAGDYYARGSECSRGPFGGAIRRRLGDWGMWRVPLKPANSTETGDRGDFFLHGGEKPGSAGCIDVGPCDRFICDWLRQDPDKPVRVSVHYGLGGVCN